jgi:hypothetical protein
MEDDTMTDEIRPLQLTSGNLHIETLLIRRPRSLREG